MAAELARVVVSLVVVLALAVVLLRFVLPRATALGGTRKTSRIQVLETRALDRHHRLAVVEVDGERMLVGYGPGGIHRLQGLTREPEPTAPARRVPLPRDLSRPEDAVH
ncbi:MAG TPA: flagellar biosynthetic protein FliO [Thermoanaerobaculia bacterium]|nr:flagellar biosynthetic protein FliO [Thermoanaerobaculia bacterium]